MPLRYHFTLVLLRVSFRRILAIRDPRAKPDRRLRALPPPATSSCEAVRGQRDGQPGSRASPGGRGRRGRQLFLLPRGGKNLLFHRMQNCVFPHPVFPMTPFLGRRFRSGIEFLRFSSKLLQVAKKSAELKDLRDGAFRKKQRITLAWSNIFLPLTRKKLESGFFFFELKKQNKKEEDCVMHYVGNLVRF